MSPVYRYATPIIFCPSYIAVGEVKPNSIGNRHNMVCVCNLTSSRASHPKMT
jgi:hypothetical protein